MTTDTTTFSSKIVEILQSSPTRSKKGTDLATELKIHGYAPAIHGKLREFIDMNVPSVVRVAHAGKDWIYGLKPPEPAVDGMAAGTARPRHRDTPVLETTVWKTFASPNTPFRLYGNQETGELRVIPPNLAAPDGAGWKVIQSCSAQQHMQIAEAWVETIADAKIRSFLETTLRAGSGPDSLFFETVKKFGLLSQWNKFRTQRIVTVFQTTLDQLGIPVKDAEPVAATTTSTNDAAHAPKSAPSGNPPSKPNGRNARDVALAALQRMSE